jgi:hypothetical protein
MRKHSLLGLALLLISTLGYAQPPGITMEMITRTLPLEGAPLAVPGPYDVVTEGAYNSDRFLVFRPAQLSGIPSQDHLPLVLWGNGGCSIDGTSYSEFLSTIASHGFLVMTTVGIEGEETRQQNADDLYDAIAWSKKESNRAGSPLNGKIDNSLIAVMGQSCGGFLSVSLGTDPRVKSIGVFNSGVTPAVPGASSPFPSTEALAELHGPVMFINGAEVDFMMEASHTNFDLVNHVPTFYGARNNAGHTATMYHPGGGEFANVASNWLMYHFKGDEDAGKMFVGENCDLCTNVNWVTDAKGL